MGDRERDKGKQKMPEGFGESSEGSARRTRARTTRGPGAQSGAGGNPSLPPLGLRDDRGRNLLVPQQRPAAQDRREEVGRVDVSWMHDPAAIASLMAALSHRQESGGVGNPGTLMPPPRTGTASSTSQVNFARDSRMTEAQHASTMVPQPRPQAPSSSQAQRRPRRQQPGIVPIFPQTHISDYRPQRQGLSTRAPGSGAQRGDTPRDGLVLQVPSTAGQTGAATGASGSGQPQPRANAGAFFLCPSCHSNLHTDQCPLGGRDAGNPAIAPRQRQPPPPHQQGLPPAPTNHAALVAMQRYSMGAYQLLLLPEHLRCPGCRLHAALLVLRPQRHLCLCAVCRVSARLVCLSCAGFVPTGNHPRDKG